MARAIGGFAAGLLALCALGACTDWPPVGTRPVAQSPGSIPADIQPDLATPGAPSDASLSLARYYARVQADLLAQGLLRQDGGGPDTPFGARELTRNFQRIALTDEYHRGAGLTVAPAVPGPVRKWVRPVRVQAEFGASVTAEVQQKATDTLNSYVARLSRVTGHSIRTTRDNANFHVLFMGVDDRSELVSRVLQLAPNVDAGSLSVIRDMPRSIHCLVVAFADSPNSHAYTTAIAVIRAEHPDLMRTTCIHEEVAQGLGLANDSPYARPSIFNDDDEFALLTTHDELLLRILYSPRLTAGMTAQTAEPIIADLAARLSGGPS